MNRRSLAVGISVFAFSVVAEMLCIKILRGSLTVWLNHPHRRLLLLALILVNLLNAATAMYFSSRAIRAEIKLRLAQRRHREAGVYLNHHLRNALTVIQHAAFLTHDWETIELCDDAVAKIVGVFVSTEAGLRDPSERLFSRG
jgi:hypothetical protein